MTITLPATTVECPACRTPVHVPLAGERSEDGSSLVVTADLSGARVHVQWHRGQAGGPG